MQLIFGNMWRGKLVVDTCQMVWGLLYMLSSIQLLACSRPVVWAVSCKCYHSKGGKLQPQLTKLIELSLLNNVYC